MEMQKDGEGREMQRQRLWIHEDCVKKQATKSRTQPVSAKFLNLPPKEKEKEKEKKKKKKKGQGHSL